MTPTDYDERKRLLTGPAIRDSAPALAALLLGVGDPRLPDKRLRFLHEVSEILRVAVLHGQLPRTTMQMLDGLAQVMHRAFSETIATTQEHDCFRDFIVFPFRRLLGESCRVRLYWIKYATGEYGGLIGYGMPATFHESFINKSLPVVEPPYKEIPGTSCFILSSEAIEQKFGSDGETKLWYRDCLGLGTVVDHTFTWHLDQTGLITTNITKGVCAISFDTGLRTRKGNHGAAVHYDPVVLRILDRLLAHAYAERITDVFYRLSPNLGATSTSTENISKALAITVAEVAETSADSPKTCNLDSLLAEETIQSLFVPAGHEGAPWLCAVNDTKGTRVIQTFQERAIMLRGASGFVIYGPSGCGKEMIARSIFTHSGRLGQFKKLDVVSGADGLEKFVNRLRGLDKGTFTGQRPESYPSLIAEAGNGVVFFDEFLRTLCDFRESQTQWRGLFEDLLTGRTVTTAEGKHPFNNQALLIFTGESKDWDDIKQDPRLSHWPARCSRDGALVIAPWCEFTAHSHFVFLRWCLLVYLCELGRTHGSFERAALQKLMEISGDARKGPRFIRNALRTSCVVADGRIRVSSDALRTSISAGTLDIPRAADFRTDGNGYEEVLHLGPGSPYAERLTPLERLIIRVSIETDMGKSQKSGIVSPTELENAVQEIDSQQTMRAAQYLLLAAVRRAPLTENDKKGTGPTRFEDSFRPKTAYVNRFKSFFPENAPGDWLIGGSEEGATMFEPEIMKAAGNLQAQVERISCAYPPFLHYVPFWLHPELGA